MPTMGLTSEVGNIGVEPIINFCCTYPQSDRITFALACYLYTKVPKDFQESNLGLSFDIGVAIVCCSDPKLERDARVVIDFILAVPYSTAIRWGLARYQATYSEQLLSTSQPRRWFHSRKRRTRSSLKGYVLNEQLLQKSSHIILVQS